MTTYKHKLSYFSLLFRYQRTPFFVLIIGMVISQLLLFYRKITEFLAINNTNSYFMRFDMLLDYAYIPHIFLVAFILCLVVIITLPPRMNKNSHANYTLLRLPLPRKLQNRYQYIEGILLLGSLIFVQLLNIYFCYFIYLHNCPTSYQMDQSLFLAFTRNEFLQIIFPVMSMVLLLLHLSFLLLINFCCVTYSIGTKTNRTSVGYLILAFLISNSFFFMPGYELINKLILLVTMFITTITIRRRLL